MTAIEITAADVLPNGRLKLPAQYDPTNWEGVIIQTVRAGTDKVEHWLVHPDGICVPIEERR